MLIVENLENTEKDKAENAASKTTPVNTVASPSPPTPVVRVPAGRCLRPALSLTSRARLMRVVSGKRDFKSHPNRDPPHLSKLEALSSHL